MGVAVLLDARTVLIATRLRLMPFLAILDGVRCEDNFEGHESGAFFWCG